MTNFFNIEIISDDDVPIDLDATNTFKIKYMLPLCQLDNSLRMALSIFKVYLQILILHDIPIRGQCGVRQPTRYEYAP